MRSSFAIIAMHLCRNPGGAPGGLMDFFGSPQGPQVLFLSSGKTFDRDFWIFHKKFCLLTFELVNNGCFLVRRRGSSDDCRKHRREWRTLSQNLIRCHQFQLFIWAKIWWTLIWFEELHLTIWNDRHLVKVLNWLKGQPGQAYIVVVQPWSGKVKPENRTVSSVQ